MKSDTYIKGVLSVIAACLLLLTASTLGLIPMAQADSTQRQMPFANDTYALVPVNEDGSVDVHVVSINPMETIDVNIEDADIGALQYAGPIKVVD